MVDIVLVHILLILNWKDYYFEYPAAFFKEYIYPFYVLKAIIKGEMVNGMWSLEDYFRNMFTTDYFFLFTF